MSVGWAEGRNPNPLFDTEWYFGQYTDIELSGINPLTHYAEIGWRENRTPHPLFDTAHYLEHNPDVRAAKIDPLTHYLQNGAAELRSPHPLFDARWYCETYSNANGTNPLIHYLEIGAASLLQPNPVFDAAWYAKRYPDSASNPLIHYMKNAATTGAQPHPLFDRSWYLARNPDAADAGLDPLVHYLLRGHLEPRQPHPLFDSEWYLAKYPLVMKSGENPLKHYLRVGCAANYSPNSMFDPEWYLRAYPSVVGARLSPLEHYVLYGERENRDPSAWFSTGYYRSQARLAPNESPLAHYLLEGRSAGLLTQPPRNLTQPAILPSGALQRQGKSPLRICVMAHLFYPDMNSEIRRWLQNIPYKFDLLLSTDEEWKRNQFGPAFNGIENLNALDARVVRNRGRDIAPLLVTFGSEVMRYDVCLHIHSKKSPHSDETEGWFPFLMQHLLHSPGYVESIVNRFAEETSLGAAYPPPFPPIERHMHWAGNFDTAKELMRKLGLALEEADRWTNDFPAGSMFWFRPQAIAPLLQSDLSFDSFPEEVGQINNTLAHAVERLFLLIAKKRGYSSIPIAPDSDDRKVCELKPAFLASRGGSAETFSTTYPAQLKREFIDWDQDRENAFKADISDLNVAPKAKFDAIPATIVMPTFNRASTLKAAIDSVTAQTHRNFQLIVIDDGSSDNTFEVMNAYRNDNRILYVRQTNLGVSAARNCGIALATAPYVFYLDSDNTWRSDYLRNMIVFMETGQLSAAYAGLRVIGDNDTLQYYRGDPFSWRECFNANYIDLNTFAHRLDAVNAPEIRFDERLKRLVDWDFLLRVAASGRVSFAPFIGADYYNGAQGERISRTQYVNGEIKVYENLIRAKHNSLPNGHNNEDVAAWDTIRKRPSLEKKTHQVAVRYYPDYTSNNAYQNLIYSAFEGLDLKSGSIEDCLALLLQERRAHVVFHLHWVAPIFAAAPDEKTASARVDRFIQQASRFVQLGGRIFWTIHNTLSHEGRYRDCELRLLRALSDLADTVHVHHADTVSIVDEYFRIPPEKVLVAEHGNYIGTLPDIVSKAEARTHLGIPMNAKVFTILGQLRPYKGLEDLIVAYEKVAADRDDCWLVLAGKPLQISVEELQRRLQHLPRAILHPAYVRDEDVQYYLRAADAAVLPYQSVLTSGSIYLALSFAAPPIAPNIGLLGSIIEDGTNGLLYDRTVPGSLEGSLRRFLSKPELHADLSRSARQTAELYSWESSSNKLRRQAEAPLLGKELHLKIGSDLRRITLRTGTRSLKGATCGAIVLHYKNLADTINCVRSLINQNADDLAILVLSNSDSINDALAIADRFPEVTVVQNEDNIGYAAGNNIGLRLCQDAGCSYFWILNPDVIIPKGYYKILVEKVTASREYSLFGSIVTFGNEPEKIWFGGGDVSLENGGFSTHRLIGQTLKDVPTEAFECDYLTGANIFGRTSVLGKIGYIPEEYFLYFEETDWFMRARGLGVRPLLFPDIHLTHWKRSEESGLPTKAYCYYFVRNAYIFGQRYAPAAAEERDQKLTEFREAWMQVIRKLAPDREKEFLDLFARAARDGKRGIVGRALI